MSANKKRRSMTLGIVILLIVMAFTNPPKEKQMAKLGNRFESSLNLIVFSIVSVTPRPGSALGINNEERMKTHTGIGGLGSSEYHIAAFGHVF
jgi:hypothetical protein